MTYYTDTFEHAGLHVRIYMEEYIDENDNPRTNQDDNLGVMFCDYRGYKLGDEDAPDPREQSVTCEKCDGEGEYPCEDSPAGDGRCTCETCKGVGEVELSIVDYLKREHGARVILPLMVYEHGGITMRVGRGWRSSGQFAEDGAGWDTSLVGVIFDTAEKRKELGIEDWDDERIEQDLRTSVEYYDAYLTGRVYGYDVVRCEPDEDGEVDPESRECEVLGGCGGFLCARSEDTEYMKSEARSEAESCAEEIAREQREAHRWACADVVTV